MVRPSCSPKHISTVLSNVERSVCPPHSVVEQLQVLGSQHVNMDGCAGVKRVSYQNDGKAGLHVRKSLCQVGFRLWVIKEVCLFRCIGIKNFLSYILTDVWHLTKLASKLGHHATELKLRINPGRFSSHVLCSAFVCLHWCRSFSNRVEAWTRDVKFLLRQEGRPVTQLIGNMSTVRIMRKDWENVDKAAQWIHQRARPSNQPFALYLGLNLPHPYATKSLGPTAGGSTFLTSPYWLEKAYNFSSKGISSCSTRPMWKQHG